MSCCRIQFRTSKPLTMGIAKSRTIRSGAYAVESPLYRQVPVVGCFRLVASVTEQLGDRHHKVFIVVYDEHVRGCLLSPFHGRRPAWHTARRRSRGVECTPPRQPAHSGGRVGAVFDVAEAARSLRTQPTFDDPSGGSAALSMSRTFAE